MSTRKTTTPAKPKSPIAIKRSLQLVIHAQVGKAYVPYLRKQITRAAALVDSPLQSLSLAIVNDAEMSRLHVQFMNIPGPTDVLTFPLDEDETGLATDGEVIICLPEANRRAKEIGTALREELLLYAVHGILHLAGMDDRTQREFDRMHRAEDDILSRLGVGNVFHHAATKARSASAIKQKSGGRK